MGLLDLIVLGLRQRDVFLSFVHRPFAHEFLKARRGKDGHHADVVVSNVIDRDSSFSRDEHGGASVHVSERITQMYFAKKTAATPKAVIVTCRERLKEYENAGK
jgi:hypothetical protein